MCEQFNSLYANRPLPVWDGVETKRTRALKSEKKEKEREISWRIWKEFSKVQRMDSNTMLSGYLSGQNYWKDTLEVLKGKWNARISFLLLHFLLLVRPCVSFLPAFLSRQEVQTKLETKGEKDSFGWIKEWKERKSKSRVKTSSHSSH